MELKELLGEELYAQVETKINEHNGKEPDKLKHVRYVDLSEGGFVSKEKYQASETKAKGLQTQLNDANTEIQSYKDMDIDGIKEKAADWEIKYNADTKALQDQIDQQAYDFAAERYMGGYKFSSELARKAALSEFREKKFQLQDGKFLGADDFMKQMKESNPAAFVDEEDTNQNQSRYQTFVRGTSNTFKPQTIAEEKAILDQKYSNNPYYRK